MRRQPCTKPSHLHIWRPMKNPLDTEGAPTSTARTRKKTRKSSRPELLWRNVEITGVSADVGLIAVHNRGAEPYIESKALDGAPWYGNRAGQRGHRRQDQHVAERDIESGHGTTGVHRRAAPHTKPELLFVLAWMPDAFDRVWVLTLSGHLKFARVCFTKPRYNSGLVVSASFSNELNE